MKPRYDLNNKTVLIIGGTSGIGKATALAFALSGATIIAASRRGSIGFSDNCSAIDSLKCDISDKNAIDSAFEQIRTKYERLDIAINCAGVEMKPVAFHETDVQVIDQMIGVNLRGTLLCMQHEIGLMIEQKAGSIVNVSSVAGLKGFPGGAAYSSAKAGVSLATRSVAHEYARSGIRVNCVAPGLIESEMANRMRTMDPAKYNEMVESMPFGRGGHVDEAADAIMWLASDAASFVNGETLVVDSGYLA